MDPKSLDKYCPRYEVHPYRTGHLRDAYRLLKRTILRKETWYPDWQGNWSHFIYGKGVFSFKVKCVHQQQVFASEPTCSIKPKPFLIHTSQNEVNSKCFDRAVAYSVCKRNDPDSPCMEAFKALTDCVNECKNETRWGQININLKHLFRGVFWSTHNKARYPKVPEKFSGELERETVASGMTEAK